MAVIRIGENNFICTCRHILSLASNISVGPQVINRSDIVYSSQVCKSGLASKAVDIVVAVEADRFFYCHTQTCRFGKYKCFGRRTVIHIRDCHSIFSGFKS